jgi:hypothetical protein
MTLQVSVLNVLAAFTARGDFLAVVRFEVFTAVAMKNGVVWDITDDGGAKFFRNVGSYKSHTA